jgi:hypothetical protein
MKDDLKQQIAEFVLQRRHVAAPDRVGDFISLLDRIRRDRREILLPVPRAAVLQIAQTRHDCQKTDDRWHQGFFVGTASRFLRKIRW